jgi:UDP-GlcNAc3NAcA epimerase
MIKLITIIGARPQIIKAAAISRAIKNRFSDQIQELIIHTGQHYDENMSEVFFTELSIPRADYNLNVGSGAHGSQTAEMIKGIEEVLVKEKPQAVLTYGDTNSTLAAAVAASKIHIPVVHVEAGLRSFSKAMPEEINRIMCDHVSTLLFSPTNAGIQNLEREGFALNNEGPYTIDNPKVYHSGDVMYDNSLHFSVLAEDKAEFFTQHDIDKDNYILCTIHRNNNTDEPERLEAIFRALLEITERGEQLVLPIHPRTSKLLEKNLSAETYSKVKSNENLKIIPPASFLEMTLLEKYAQMIITDSGGVQKEAFFFEKPCVILRPQTEWTELVDHGCAILADASFERILEAYKHFKSEGLELEFPRLFGDGKAGEFVCESLLGMFDGFAV